MRIEDIKSGDVVWVRVGNKLMKTRAFLANSGRMGFFHRPFGWDPIPYIEGEVFSADELPAARKQLAADRARERKAEAARLARVKESEAVAEELFARGVVGSSSHCNKIPFVRHNGTIDCMLTPEQARTLLGALGAAP